MQSYYEKNKEKMIKRANEYNKRPTTCECGFSSSYAVVRFHKKTYKHYITLHIKNGTYIKGKTEAEFNKK